MATHLIVGMILAALGAIPGVMLRNRLKRKVIDGNVFIVVVLLNGLLAFVAYIALLEMSGVSIGDSANKLLGFLIFGFVFGVVSNMEGFLETRN